MITHCPPQAVLEAPPQGHPLLEVAIAARAACPQPQMDFWLLCEQDQTPCGWLCRHGAALYIAGQPAHATALAGFASTVGYGELITDLPLPLGAHEPMLAWEWQQAVPLLPELPEDCTLRYLTAQSSRLSVVDFAQLQQSCGVFEDEQAACYTTELSHAVRRGAAGAVGLLCGGRLLAGAAVNHISGKRSILGAVAVLPQYRRMGLATAMATAGVALSFAMGARPLLCSRKELHGLYHGVGFAALPPVYRYSSVH